MTERLNVMISSTALDLPDHRGGVKDACLREGMFPLMVEHLLADDADPIQASRDMVDRANIYLGIFAYRYGYVPKGYDISITEIEYNRAVKHGILEAAKKHVAALGAPEPTDPAPFDEFKFEPMPQIEIDLPRQQEGGDQI